ncbi:MAG TPA: UbiX family flavin prenyltransferase [Terriglobales bacterium]|nr:UbiX family flavin prenyltransferase [Terriglobales bacterium]
MQQSQPSRLIIGITGASGVIYGIRLLQLLQKTNVETHLIVSKWGARTLTEETDFTVEQVQQLAAFHYGALDQTASIASGSFPCDGMVVAPCSARTLAAIAHGYGDSLIHRAADVILKERRKLVLVVRETPLSDIHLENMLKLSRMGAVIAPPVPAFYNRPAALDDIVEHTALRLLDQFGIHLESSTRWGTPSQALSAK